MVAGTFARLNPAKFVRLEQTPKMGWMSNLGTDIQDKPSIQAPARGPQGWLSLGLRALIGLSILVFLFLYFDFAEIAKHLRALERGPVIGACLVLALQYVLASGRWWAILRRLETPIAGREALAMFGLGALANLVLVTSVAGLSVRAFLLVRLGVRASAAAASLVAERMAAMTGLIISVAIGSMFAFSLLAPHIARLETSWSMAVYGLGGLMVAGAGILAIWRYDWAKRFVQQVRVIFGSYATTVFLIVLSLLIVVAGFAAVAVLARGMDIVLNPIVLIAILPFVAFVSALPISIGGWGVREGSMVAGLGLMGVGAEEAVALSIAYGLAGLLMTLTLGAMASLLWMRGSKILARGKLASRHELS